MSGPLCRWPMPRRQAAPGCLWGPMPPDWGSAPDPEEVYRERRYLCRGSADSHSLDSCPKNT